MSPGKASGYLLVVFSLVSFPALGHWQTSEHRIHTALPYRGGLLPERSQRFPNRPTIGLYGGKGTWLAGKEHLKMFFNEHELNYQTLSTNDLIEGKISAGTLPVLIMPGGESSDYLRELGKAGETNIKSFVETGGGYLGICAGAFYAVSHREGGNATGPYGIGLLDGTAYDGTALKTKPFIEGMMDFDMALHPLVQGLGSLFRIVMFGGPSFRYTGEEKQKKHLDELAYFQKIHEPAMIVFQFGKGRVFLSGPHLEIEEDRTDWGSEFYDPDSEWPILDRVVRFLGGDRTRGVN